MKMRHANCILIWYKKNILALENVKGKGKEKKDNISRILQNLELVFTGVFLHYDNIPESETDESIGERTKLRRQRFNEIAENEKTIDLELFRKYFGYLIPSNIYKVLSDTKITKGNKTQADLIKNNLTNLKTDTENTPKDEVNKIEK